MSAPANPDVRLVQGWRALPYSHFGVCVLCKRDREGDEEVVTWSGQVLLGRPMYLYGHSPDLCICFRCWAERGGTAPKQDPASIAAGVEKRREQHVAVERTEDQLDVITQIMALREQGHGYPKIAALLNDAGVPTFGKPGAKWHGPTVRNIVLKQQPEQVAA